MPQETKARPFDAEVAEVAPGVKHEDLQGWIPQMASDEEIRVALEKAFDYRGDVTITLKNGQTITGYVFDRHGGGDGGAGPTLAQSYVRLLPADGGDAKIPVKYADIAALHFSGRDTAAGKSFETWVKKYWERKRAGETNIRLDPEQLD